jgi:hypothetical protein
MRKIGYGYNAQTVNFTSAKAENFVAVATAAPTTSRPLLRICAVFFVMNTKQPEHMHLEEKKREKLETNESAETKSPVLRALSTTGKGITGAERPGAQDMNFGDEDPGTRALFSTGEGNVAAEGPGTCPLYSTGKGNTRAFGRS